jgi:hypothetical protein
MRDALHRPDGTQPLPPMPVHPDALSGSSAIPRQRTVAPQPWAPPTTPEDIHRPVQHRRPPARTPQTSPQTPRLEPPHEKQRWTSGSIIGFLIALAIGAAVGFAILRRVVELFFS